jgi:hypothetical protein
VAANIDNELDRYRALLKLYPRTYREEYGYEMLTTFEEMLHGAVSKKARRQVWARVLKDFVLSLGRQTAHATGDSYAEAPNYVKRDMTVGISLTAPFFLVYSYNVLSMALRRPIVLASLEVHIWVLYSIILPGIALALLGKTFYVGIYNQLVQHGWRQALRATFHDWLFLGVIVAYFALVAIF